jgi:hypothetical protein
MEYIGSVDYHGISATMWHLWVTIYIVNCQEATSLSRYSQIL